MTWMDQPDPLWVLGTDTDVGKTHVSALLARQGATTGPVTYRKPFQSGVPHPLDPASDLARVQGTGITVENWVTLRAPLSPLAAAEAEGRTLDLDEALAWCRRPWEGRLILEGVGGVMVPLAGRTHFLAWATDLGWPALLVARGGLGTLNHTLLSCEALMLRGWRVSGVLLNAGVDHSSEAARRNADILSRLLPCPVHVLETR